MWAVIEKQCQSWPVSIFMAGDVDAAKDICQAYCDEVGFCVTVTPTTYVYTNGREAGFIVGLINYPRFPSTPLLIQDHAQRLAVQLRETLGQQSYSIQTPAGTVWHSWRGEE